MEHKDKTNYSLILTVKKNSKLVFELTFRQEEFHPLFIEQMINHMVNILSNIHLNSEENIENIEILASNEKNKYLYEWNESIYNDLTNKKENNIVSLFKQAANENQNKIAAVNGSKIIRYRDLDEKSNQFANYLIKKNINKEDVVAIYIYE